jgi:hypothetical protein
MPFGDGAPRGTMNELVTLIREYAQDSYYRYSWDVVATSWSDAEIAATIAGAKTRRGALAKAWGKLQLIDAKRPRHARPVKPASLFEFLGKRGGLKHTPDLAYILDGNPFIGGAGPLLRQSGMTLDHAREAAVEAGYLHCDGWNTSRQATSTINDLLDAIDREARGEKVYPMGEEPYEPQEQPEQDHACPF